LILGYRAACWWKLGTRFGGALLDSPASTAVAPSFRFAKRAYSKMSATIPVTCGAAALVPPKRVGCARADEAARTPPPCGGLRGCAGRA
jgi:hypothetical protein